MKFYIYTRNQVLFNGGLSNVYHNITKFENVMTNVAGQLKAKEEVPKEIKEEEGER